MAYAPTTWADSPSTSTPITAAQLNRLEAAIGAGLWVRSARDYGAVLDDTTNDATAIQDAITAAAGAGGGVVLIPGRAYVGTSTLTMPAAPVSIMGLGWEASWLRRASSATNPLLDYSGTATGGGGHRYHQGLHNISLRGGGSSGTLLRAYYADRLRLTDVFFYDSVGIGCDLVEVWDSRFTRCAWNAVGGLASDTPGANSAKPQVWIRNSAAASEFGNGTDNSNMIWFTDCHWEDFASGALWIERGHSANTSNPNGIFITHGKFETHRVRNIPVVVGDQASLVHFRDCDVVMGTFHSGTTTPVPGMLVGGVTNIVLDGIRFVGGDAVQSMSNGIEIYGQTGGAYAIQSISHEGQNPTNALVSFGGLLGLFDVGAVASSATAALFAGSHPESHSVTYAASITPAITAKRTTKRVTLTGNITINAPAGGFPGARLTLDFLQDATGGRTVTFNAAFKATWTPTTTANKRNTITFEYDGTNWVQVATATNL